MSHDMSGFSLTRTTPRLLTLVFATMILLFIVTGFLTKAYNNEKSERAQHQFEAAEQLASEKRYSEAIEHYSAALRLSRDELEYKQALALALIHADRPQEAEGYLQEIAKADPSNGIVNEQLALIQAERGDVVGAQEYYQRAIYGIWPQDPVANRIRVHFELIDWLASRNEYTLVKAELLRLLDEVPDNVDAQYRIAQMFLTVQAPEEARGIFTNLANRDSSNCHYLVGVGDAEFDLADYPAAQTAYGSALKCDPNDMHSQLQFQRASEVVDLNPMARGLSIRQRVIRSRQMISRAVDELSSCMQESSENTPEQVQTDLETGRQIVADARQDLNDETVESNINLAERLHEARTGSCGAMAPVDETLSRTLQGLQD